MTVNVHQLERKRFSQLNWPGPTRQRVLYNHMVHWVHTHGWPQPLIQKSYPWNVNNVKNVIKMKIFQALPHSLYVPCINFMQVGREPGSTLFTMLKPWTTLNLPNFLPTYLRVPIRLQLGLYQHRSCETPQRPRIPHCSVVGSWWCRGGTEQHQPSVRQCPLPVTQTWGEGGGGNSTHSSIRSEVNWLSWFKT